MKCFIDNREAETDPAQSLAITLSIASVSQIETGRTGYSKNLKLPITLHNREILNDAGEILSPQRFNQTPHTARIEKDGCIVMEGTPMMTKREEFPDGSGWYHLCIIGAGKEWIQTASERMFNELDIDFESVLNASTVLNSWSGEQIVRFFPVQRDRFSLPTQTLQSGVRMMTFEDYHPFLHVHSLIRQIAAQSGYTIQSSFLESPLFDALYISGKYPERDSSLLKERMGFLAGRFSSTSATADHLGRIYADPLSSIASLGNLVETADPHEQQNGVSLPDLYNHNECFRKEGDRFGFFPVESVVAGFEYDIQYQSDYIISNRQELCCFNTLYLDDGHEREYKVMNRNTDRRHEFRANWNYTLIVFDHLDGNSYQFTYDKITNPNADLQNLQPSDYVTLVLKSFSERCVNISTPTGETILNPQLQIRFPDNTYQPYTQDWALYDGYVTETGQIDIRITARSTAREIKPSQPQYFDQIYFGGAREGMKLTLSAKTTLKPIFVSHPGEGNSVNFAQVAAHEIRQIELINALKQMFNLYFYTDTRTKTIYIEPREEFYGSQLIDWSDKIDLEKPIQVEELGEETGNLFTLQYQTGDGAVTRWNRANKQVLGAWSAEIQNRFTQQKEKTYENPLFTASINQQNVYPDAPSASIVQAGDRDADGENPGVENLNFMPKIVCYAGVKTLPEGEYWGWPAYGNQYPMIAFHDPDGNTPSLCFEDRNNQQGLHRYYDKTIETYNQGLKITLYLHLTPDEIEPFIIPNDMQHDFRARFKLRIHGEEIICRLEEITDYNPDLNQSTRCTFLKTA